MPPPLLVTQSSADECNPPQNSVTLYNAIPSTKKWFLEIFGTHRDRAAAPDGTRCQGWECPYGALILATGRPARVDDWTHAPGPIAARYRELGYGQAVAAPIIIDGSIWGCIGAYGEAG